MKMSWWSLSKLVLSAGLALSVTAIGYFAWTLSRPIQNEISLYEIAPGSGIGQVARDLSRQGILHEPYSLIMWSYLQGTTGAIHAGEYQFTKLMTLLDVHQSIVSGSVKRYSLTIVEGWTFREMGHAMQQATKIRKTLSNLDPATVMAALGKAEQHPEGRFFPDTYVYSAGTSDVEIFKQAYERMSKQLDSAWSQRADKQTLRDKDEVLVLASIIEKEARIADERAIISGVFHNRLRVRMRLQTDPTVIYGLGEQFNGNLTRKHLQTDNPYNTYTRSGLPPTPISLPGAASLHAAVNPAQTQALYFVARKDGSHVFSNTLQEHNQAVIKYQLGGNSRPFSSYPGNNTGSVAKQANNAAPQKAKVENE